MNAFWTAVSALMFLAAGLFIAAVSGMAQAEIRARLGQLPRAVIGLAIRRIPQDLREDLGEEWRSELGAIFDASQDIPVTGLAKATWYATCLLVRGPAVARALNGTERHAREVHQRGCLSRLRLDAKGFLDRGVGIQWPFGEARRLTAALFEGVIDGLSRVVRRMRAFPFHAFFWAALGAVIGAFLARLGITAVVAAISFAAACGILWGCGAMLFGGRHGPQVMGIFTVWSVASGLGMMLGGFFVPLGVICMLIGASPFLLIPYAFSDRSS